MTKQNISNSLRRELENIFPNNIYNVYDYDENIITISGYLDDKKLKVVVDRNKLLSYDKTIHGELKDYILISESDVDLFDISDVSHYDCQYYYEPYVTRSFSNLSSEYSRETKRSINVEVNANHLVISISYFVDDSPIKKVDYKITPLIIFKTIEELLEYEMSVDEIEKIVSNLEEYNIKLNQLKSEVEIISQAIKNNNQIIHDLLKTKKDRIISYFTNDNALRLIEFKGDSFEVLIKKVTMLNK